MSGKRIAIVALIGWLVFTGLVNAVSPRSKGKNKQLVAPAALTVPASVAEDPALRMPGTQPDQGVTIESPNRCLNCHSDYDDSGVIEPGDTWHGSMMAQATRDPIFWACLTVAAQDSVWALGTPHATDLCLRCHTPTGWLGGRSDPTNGSLLTGTDWDGVSCDACHRMYDPFYENTYAGTRESNNWVTYWDEAGNFGPGSGTLSQVGALTTRDADAALAAALKMFNGNNFYVNNAPRYATYDENASGQYFVSPNDEKRASFADANARHAMLYSRHHKSRYFCGTCHDVSNPALANLAEQLNADLGLSLPTLPDQSGGQHLISEQYPAYRYFHVERTFSEFMSSAYATEVGASTNPEFVAQGGPVTVANSCQDCHMPDSATPAKACHQNDGVVRPTESNEHPDSGMPKHDMTGGNAWITYILPSLDPRGPVYDARNVELLDQGPDILTLDLSAGETPTGQGALLKQGSDRAVAQLQMAGTIKDVQYAPATGALQFRVQNNTGHKLISGFPEGRRMWVNIRFYAGDTLLQEVNPYSDSVGTLKGLGAGSSPPLSANEVYSDAIVYEAHTSSELTGEEKTFHFVLATGRSKDNRIPPKGFDVTKAAERESLPVHDGNVDADYFTAEEYAGGYDQVSLTGPQGASRVEIRLYYQGTSREYIEFLRDEINGTVKTLPDSAYIAQSDPFFTKLKAWGDTIWNLWHHNHGLDGSGKAVPGIVPVLMHSTTDEFVALPVVTATQRNDDGNRLNKMLAISYTFSKDVSASIDLNDLALTNASTGATVNLTGATVTWLAASQTARWDLSALDLPLGWYTATLQAAGIQDSDGLQLDGDNDGVAGGDHVSSHVVTYVGDLNADGSVTQGEAEIVVANNGLPGDWSTGDADGDGTVEFIEAAEAVANIGAIVPAP